MVAAFIGNVIKINLQLIYRKKKGDYMGNYETNPNQKVISVLKDGKATCDTSHVYMKAQKEAMFNAMKELTPTTFEVWLYLASQADDYTFGFSPAAVCAETSIKKSSIQEGIRVLIANNYLIQRPNSNIYDFYEVPKTDEEKEGLNKMYICPHTDNKEDGFTF